MSTTSLVKDEAEIDKKPLLLTQIWNYDIKTCYTSLDNYEFRFCIISIWTECWVKIEYIMGTPKLEYFATLYFPKEKEGMNFEAWVILNHEGSAIWQKFGDFFSQIRNWCQFYQCVNYFRKKGRSWKKKKRHNCQRIWGNETYHPSRRKQLSTIRPLEKRKAGAWNPWLSFVSIEAAPTARRLQMLIFKRRAQTDSLSIATYCSQHQ